MPDLISDFVNAHGTRLHYYRREGEKPAIVLIHGITDDGLCWTPVADVLAGSNDVIMVDMRGHGLSEAPQDGYTLGNMAAELAELIRALGLEKPLLLGHSMGAITTLVLAGLYPDLPRAILLEDPPPFWRNNPDDESFDQTRDNLKTMLVSNKRKTRDDFLAELRTNLSNWPEAEWEPWLNSKHRYSPRISALVQPGDIEALKMPELFKLITCPVLFIQADEKLGAASKPGDIKELSGYIPQMVVAGIAGAGHNIRREQFQRYMEVVDRFLKEI